MGGNDPDTTAQALLAHAGWLRRLALRLVGDADVADDLVQETWIAAARRSPDERESLRPWLAKVLRDAFRMRARSEGRRAAREHAATIAAPAGDEAPTPEMLVARAEAQRRLVDLVLRLEEPYRGTLLLHFNEGMSLADIARAQGVPAGTVRWRLKAALDQLRAWLDETGDRKQWVVTLLALPKGALVAQKSSKVVIALVLLLLLVGGGALFLWTRGDGAKKKSANAGERGGAAGGGVGVGGPSTTGGGSHVAGTELPIPAWLAQRDVKPRRIAGRVVLADGSPVNGAAVELASIATTGGIAVPARVTTNAAGEFDFGWRAALTYAVTAMAAGKTGATQAVDLRDPTTAPPPDKLVLELGPCDHAVFGTVRDASGGPIEGARLTWLTAGAGAVGDTPPIWGSATLSNATGAYELCVVGGRQIVITEVSADGYGAVVYQTGVWGRRKLDFALVPESTIVGRVIREDTGAPVAQALVTLTGAQWGVERTANRAAFTGTDGRFRISGVAGGAHFLDAQADGFATARETWVNVAAGQTTEPIDLVLETRSVVRGKVIDSGKPVAGVVVSARSPDRASADAVSQADGTFVLERVPRGQVRFLARPHEVEHPKTYTVDRPDQDGVVLEVDTLGTLIGTVTRKGQPVEGALVELNGINAHEIGPVRSGVDGRFEAHGLRPGTWIVFAGSDREGAFGRAPKEVQLDAGETEEVTVEMPYSAAISGTVVDQDGAPVPAVTVVFQHTGLDDVGLATTSADGRYRAAMMVGSGTYRPSVRLGSRSTQGTMRPVAGDPFPLITLPDGTSEISGVTLAVRLDHLTISGRVVDEDGGPVADARVAAEPVQGGVEPHFWRWYHQNSTMTDVDGRFTIADLSAGTYAVQARAATGAEAIVQGIAAGRRDVTVVLQSNGSINGTLAGFTTAPRVFAMRQDSRASDAPVRGTVSGARFTIPSLGPGTYVVSAYTASEVASARVDVAAGATATVALAGAGSGVVAGHVRDFATGAPVDGMSCHAFARVGESRTSGSIGAGSRSDAAGAFELSPIAAGELAVACWASGSYSDGLRLITVRRGDRLELDVPVVRLQQDPLLPIGGIGADLDRLSLVPRLYRTMPRGPAATAGLQDGDVITAIDSKSVTELSPHAARLLLIYHPPGTSVPVTVRRGTRTLSATIVLGPTDEP